MPAQIYSGRCSDTKLRPETLAHLTASPKGFDIKSAYIQRPVNWTNAAYWREYLEIRLYPLFTQCDCPNREGVIVFRGDLEQRETALAKYLEQAHNGFPIKPGSTWWTVQRHVADMTVETFHPTIKIRRDKNKQMTLLELNGRIARRLYQNIDPMFDWEEIKGAEALEILFAHGLFDMHGEHFYALFDRGM
jgi:hypothetical protein